MEALSADEVVREVIKLKQAGTPLTDEMHKTATGATKRLLGKAILGEWSPVQAC